MNTLKTCDYNSPTNDLCRSVQFRIDDKQMLKCDARLLTQPLIQTGPNCRANVRIGRIPLNGHLFTPKPIPALAIGYFGTNMAQNENILKNFTQVLLEVNFSS